MTTDQDLFRVENISKVYRMGEVEVHALRDVSFRIDPGEFVAIMGPSGSGKSTLMQIIGCLDKPTSGSFYLRGRKVSSLSDDELATVRNRDIGFVFQTFNLLPGLTLVENVELPLVYAGVRSAKERRKRAMETLELVGLSERVNHRPNEISGGQRQRVAIARALVTKPAIILADEPTGNLDSKTGEDIMNFFGELNRQGNTIVLVTHDRKTAEYAGRIIHIRDGRLEKTETRSVDENGIPTWKEVVNA